MMTLTRFGSSIAMLPPHPRIVRIERRARKHRRGAALALNEHLEAAAGRGEFNIDTGERETLPDPVPVGAGRGHADAAILDEHGFAAARVRIARRNLGVDDLEGA